MPADYIDLGEARRVRAGGDGRGVLRIIIGYMRNHNHVDVCRSDFVHRFAFEPV